MQFLTIQALQKAVVFNRVLCSCSCRLRAALWSCPGAPRLLPRPCSY